MSSTTTSTDSASDLASGSLPGGFLAEVMRIARAGDDRARAQRDALTAFAVRVASAGLLYLSQIVLARWIGGYDYGIYVFVWSLVLLLGGLSSLGLNLGAIRLVAEYRETGQGPMLRGLLRGSRLLALACGTAVAALGLAVLWLAAPYVSETYRVPLALALACLPLYALTDVQDGIGRGHGWMTVALLPPYVLRPLFLLCGVAVAQLAGLPMTAATVAAAAIVATWGAALVQTLMLRHRLTADETTATVDASAAAVSREYDWRRWLRTSSPLLVIAGAEILLQNTDVFVISCYLPPSDVGIYYAAAKTMSLIMFVHYAVGSAVANRFAALKARGDDAALAAFVRDAVNWTFWPSLAGAALILALGMPLLWLFGPQFTAGYPVMLIMVLGFLARSSMGPAEFLLNMLGAERLCAALLVVTVLLNIILNLALVPAFGIIGAASATATSLAAAAAMAYFAVRSRLGFDVAIWNNIGRRAA